MKALCIYLFYLAYIL